MVAILALPILFFGFALVFVKQKEKARVVKGSADYRTCEANLKDLENKAALFAEAKDGMSPRNLQELVPEFVEELPTCPAGGSYYYERMQVSQDAPMIRGYSCLGDAHKVVGAPLGRPSLRSDFGLLEAPGLSLAE